MANKNETLIISDVTAMYPKINQTYKFDSNAGDKGRTVPCAPSDDGSEYTMTLVLNQAQASSLYGTMKAAYVAGKHEKWDDFTKASGVFKMGDEADTFTIETKLKGKFGTDLTEPPKQFDANNKQMPADFLLTSGSKVNVLVSLVPYEPVRGCGVSLRLRQVQVIELAELKQRSAFDVIDGGFNSQSDGFATELPTAAPLAVADDGFDMGTPAPSKPTAVVKIEAPVAANAIEDALDKLEDLTFDVPKAG
jgi:hypothetical protein